MERYRDIIPEFDRFKNVIHTPQPYDIRVNTIKSSISEIKDILKQDEQVFEQSEWNDNFLKVNFEPGKNILHWLGKYHVQESVSGIPPFILNPEPGERVVDICAAPGSKTTQMSAFMGNTGEILANDIQRNRIRSLLSNISRLGCVNVQVFERDGRNLPEKSKFDKVLVDAPCSAEGNARKNSDLIYGADMDVITKLSKLQENLLEKAFRLCKNGGTIVYSTCTFAPEENEVVVSKFLDYGKLEKPDFNFPHSSGITEWNNMELENELEKCIRVYPHQLDSGGIFVAKFKKTS